MGRDAPTFLRMDVMWCDVRGYTENKAESTRPRLRGYPMLRRASQPDSGNSSANRSKAILAPKTTRLSVPHEFVIYDSEAGLAVAVVRAEYNTAGLGVGPDNERSR